MDLFGVLNSFESVKRVSNLRKLEGTINFLFFICPRIRSKGMTLNQFHTGLTAQYIEGASISTTDRLRRVQRFSEEATKAGISFEVTAIFASADSLILFPLPVEPPKLPVLDDYIRVIPNLEVVRARLGQFGEIYAQEPWNSVPQKFLEPEVSRLGQSLPDGTPENLRKDFIKRVFSGFALDGLVVREGIFGDNPVLLGVESPGVTMLQNSALKKVDWLPIVDLAE